MNVKMKGTPSHNTTSTIDRHQDTHADHVNENKGRAADRGGWCLTRGVRGPLKGIQFGSLGVWRPVYEMIGHSGIGIGDVP